MDDNTWYHVILCVMYEFWTEIDWIVSFLNSSIVYKDFISDWYIQYKDRHNLYVVNAWLSLKVAL